MGATTDIPLDHAHIVAAAAFTATELAYWGVARVHITPGDATDYGLLIATPGNEWYAGREQPGQYYWVALCNSFGAGYPWHGNEVDAGYAGEKWTNAGATKGDRAHVGRVVAAFLTAVAEARRAGTGEPAAAAYERLPNRCDAINGSHLINEVDVAYSALVATFGEPGEGDGYKVDAQWNLRFPDGTVATIYNYKDGHNYLGDEGEPVTAITDWHVGGFDRRAVDLVVAAVADARHPGDRS